MQKESTSLFFLVRRKIECSIFSLKFPIKASHGGGGRVEKTWDKKASVDKPIPWPTCTSGSELHGWLPVVQWSPYHREEMKSGRPWVGKHQGGWDSEGMARILL